MACPACRRLPSRVGSQQLSTFLVEGGSRPRGLTFPLAEKAPRLPGFPFLSSASGGGEDGQARDQVGLATCFSHVPSEVAGGAEQAGREGEGADDGEGAAPAAAAAARAYVPHLLCPVRALENRQDGAALST